MARRQDGECVQIDFNMLQNIQEWGQGVTWKFVSGIQKSWKDRFDGYACQNKGRQERE